MCLLYSRTNSSSSVGSVGHSDTVEVLNEQSVRTQELLDFFLYVIIILNSKRHSLTPPKFTLEFLYGNSEKGSVSKVSISSIIDFIGFYTVEHTIYASVFIIAYIACGSVSLYIKTLYFFLSLIALSAAAIVANIKIRYDAKTPQFALFWTRVICVFYSIWNSILVLFSS